MFKCGECGSGDHRKHEPTCSYYCDCYKHERQVCDICQGIDKNSKDQRCPMTSRVPGHDQDCCMVDSPRTFYIVMDDEHNGRFYFGEALLVPPDDTDIERLHGKEFIKASEVLPEAAPDNRDRAIEILSDALAEKCFCGYGEHVKDTKCDACVALTKANALLIGGQGGM